MQKKKILIVLGTRPEAIKLAPVVLRLRESPDSFDTRVCHTGQHRQMADDVLLFFNIVPDYDLDLMIPGQDLHMLTARIITGMKPVLEDFQPDWVLVQGDTTTAMAAAMAAFYSGFRVGHVEAGLRTYNLQNPFPEEMNRQVIGRLAEAHFAATEGAMGNLIAERVAGCGVQVAGCKLRVAGCGVVVTGNTVVDALFMGLERLKDYRSTELDSIQEFVGEKRFILVTCHRRENLGRKLEGVLEAVAKIAQTMDVSVVFPVHPNPVVREPVYAKLGNISGIHLVEPVSYPVFIWLMKQCELILTDSGGIQEEALSLGKSVLVMREITERTEALDTGKVKMVGTDPEEIIRACKELLNRTPEDINENEWVNPFGDGQAARRIVNFLAGV